ncbi:MAG: response regulator [Candidatus Promineofilum sp.]|nr:response regulator [Promineifilum sp.]
MTQNAKRILIVDDEAPLRFLLSKQLTRAGFNVATAADGAAALAVAAETTLDAIVLDVVMPGLDGFEVCRRLKDNPRTAAIPVVFLSASCSGDFRRRAFRLGGADFLAKPFQVEELPAYLHALLGDAPAARPTVAGRIVSVIGADRSAGSAAAAARLAESDALRGGNPVMLIDLELPAGAIGARLQLAGGPNVRVLLHDTGEPVTREAISRVAQRVHFGLEVIPAPFTPSALGHDEPDAQRLADMLDMLTASGYYVVLHLTSRMDEVTVAALRRSDAIYTVVGAEFDLRQREAWHEALVAEGAARERIVSLEEATKTPRAERAAEATPARARQRQPVRAPEPAFA